MSKNERVYDVNEINDNYGQRFIVSSHSKPSTSIISDTLEAGIRFIERAIILNNKYQGKNISR